METVGSPWSLNSTVVGSPWSLNSTSGGNGEGR